MSTDSHNCSLCGAAVRPYLTDGPGSPIKVSCFPHSLPDHPLPLENDDEAEERQRGWLKKFDFDAPDDFRCPIEVIEPVVIRFHSKSGKVVLGNDLREAVGQTREAEDANEPHVWTRYWKYKGERGNVEYIRHRAAEGFLTGPVGNTHIWFAEKDEGLVVQGLSGGDDETYDRLGRECIHDVGTELWWFAIVDFDLIKTDLPMDNYDREAVIYDLPGGPGEYEFTYHHERVFHAWELSPAARSEPSGVFAWATLRKV
jgi:hypothetical protein